MASFHDDRTMAASVSFTPTAVNHSTSSSWLRVATVCGCMAIFLCVRGVPLARHSHPFVACYGACGVFSLTSKKRVGFSPIAACQLSSHTQQPTYFQPLS